MEELFPRKDGIDMSRLQMTPQGLYSVTRRRDGERMMDILRSNIPNLHKKIVTDATACVGSDTLRFSFECAHVHAIELKHENALVLAHNLGVFGARNVTVHEGDATKLFKWKTDILYVDPPWGGPEYYKHPKMDLFLGHVRLDKWLEALLKTPERPSYIVLKLPRNYNFAHIQFLPSIEKTLLFRVRNFMVAILC